MQTTIERPRFRVGLSFYGTSGFLGGFLGARLFATLNPTVVVVKGEIHFHHFWYGLIMVVTTGWIAIALGEERWHRILASIFGLGVGFIGDEVGLLLTFQDYTTPIELYFFIGAIAAIIFLSLTWRYRAGLEREVINIRAEERLTQIGIFIALFSTFFFASDRYNYGFLTAAVGIVIFLVGEERKRLRK